MEFFNDRRPNVVDDHEWPVMNGTPLDKAGLRVANKRLRGATPDYRKANVNRQIRTASVRRHRNRQHGREDFASVGEYLGFMTGVGNSGGY